MHDAEPLGRESEGSVFTTIASGSVSDSLDPLVIESSEECVDCMSLPVLFVFCLCHAVGTLECLPQVWHSVESSRCR